jgi:Zinc knuckle
MSHRAASIDSVESTTRTLPTSQDIARLRSTGRSMKPQELKELLTKVKALEEMARLEDRLRVLENRKRSISHAHEFTPTPPRQSDPQLLGSDDGGEESSQRPVETLYTDTDTSSDQSSTVASKQKRRRTSRGIKVTPSYTLSVSSSLREWGDWKRDMDRVFEGDPTLYRRSSQKILKSLDYLDPNMKSLWYTYREQQPDQVKWLSFVQWTKENIQGGQNSVANLYEQLDNARQLSEKSPIQFNAYLSSIERDLPQKDEKTSAMTFYSKLTRELKRQFKTADIPIPETRAKCVAVAQRIWEGLHGTERPGRNSKDIRTKEESKQPTIGSKNPRPDSRRDRLDRYHRDHRKEERDYERKPDSQPTCYKCGKVGHYADRCPEPKDVEKDKAKPKIQSTLREHSPIPGSRSPSPVDEESDDSLN